jgi:hypothetical protein
MQEESRARSNSRSLKRTTRDSPPVVEANQSQGRGDAERLLSVLEAKEKVL